ncbi:MAG: RDD family protein [Actinomycetota bacterium]|nr:RDD family protein [Actinomycetota bacterium]
MNEWESEQQGEAGGGSPGEDVGAELLPRFLARLIDSVLLGIVFFVVIVPIFIVAIFGAATGVGGFGGGFGVAGLLTGILFAAIVVGYFALMESMRGQTVGKMIMKLKTQGPDGENPSLEMAIKRNIWYALGIIPVIGSIAQLGAVIYIAFTINQSETNTGWHDEFAGGTRVVKIS